MSGSNDFQNTILVTGAAGFIGARFVESCNQKGIPIVSVDQKPFFASRAEHLGFDFGRQIDLGDLFSWLDAGQKFKAIVHLGACTDTFEMNQDYLKKVNLEYSQKLWTYASQHRIPFFYASSAATYGGGELGYSDDEKLIARFKPLNPYGESKRLFDLWVLEQENQGKASPPAWAGFKFFNVYGFGERHKGRMASVILHAFDQISSKGQVKLFRSHKTGIGDGEQKRDFIWVGDVVNVLHFAIQKPIERGIFNLGTGKARTFKDLASAVANALERKLNVEFIDTPLEIRDKYQYFTQAEMHRLRAQGYIEPFTSLEEGAARTVKSLTQP